MIYLNYLVVQLLLVLFIFVVQKLIMKKKIIEKIEMKLELIMSRMTFVFCISHKKNSSILYHNCHFYDILLNVGERKERKKYSLYVTINVEFFFIS